MKQYLDYGDFYDIAKYYGKPYYTEKEVACNAYDYLAEFEYSKQKGSYYVTSTIQELLCLLDEDSSEECEIWANEIRNELGLNQTVNTYDNVCQLMNGLPKGTKITIELN